VLSDTNGLLTLTILGKILRTRLIMQACSYWRLLCCSNCKRQPAMQMMLRNKKHVLD